MPMRTGKKKAYTTALRPATAVTGIWVKTLSAVRARLHCVPMVTARASVTHRLVIIPGLTSPMGSTIIRSNTHRIKELIVATPHNLAVMSPRPWHEYITKRHPRNAAVIRA